jgi:hypothetical protein
MTPLQKRMEEDWQWACQAPEVEQHDGNYVAIRNKKVVAVGQDADAVRKEAAALEQCPEEEIFLFLVIVDIPPDMDFPV